MKILAISHILPAAAWWSTSVVAPAAAAPLIAFDCSGGCLERKNFAIKAIVHGTKTDPFWQQVQAASQQAANDMNVNLEFQLYDTFDTSQMASDIRNHVAAAADGSGLLVTIPNADVSNAVKEAVDARIPVVGINSGASFGQQVETMGFVAPDDEQGGKLAAETLFGLQGGNITSALYINDEVGNQAMAFRYDGLQEGIGGATVEILAVDGTDSSAMEATIASKLSGCPYQAILLSGPRSLPAAVAAYEKNGCTLKDTSLGAFETSGGVYDAIGNDQLDFTIGNNHYLQGALGTIIAALAVTGGKSLAPSGADLTGAYLPGPTLIIKATLPTDTKKLCEKDAFPVCPNNKVTWIVHYPTFLIVFLWDTRHLTFLVTYS
mmetsp:Transcript_23821/g.51477  ORF Transcript_23821/g.51477 Transcript_23821/m.51477 type:complete len:378 (+) Transcript_23821:141-1274(+)